MQKFKNNRFLNAINHQPVDATPIWIMRQAGRYLPEYRATRERAGSFVKLCQTPELACEVTLQPLSRFPLDAAIIFSDILTIPDAMGLGLSVIESVGPVFAKPANTADAIKKLTAPDPEKLSYVYEAIRLVSHELSGNIPLIGFCGSPWTLAAYMVQGKAEPGFPLLQKMMMEEPTLLHNLLDVLAKSVAAHLLAQAQAGASALMLFDTWGGMLATENYHQFSLHYMKKVVAEIQRDSNYNIRKVPVILFTKGGHHWLEAMADSGCSMIGVDWEISLKEARSRLGGRTAIQGNLNPAVLLQPEQVIRREVLRVLDSYGHGSGHVFNLGHGITPEVPVDHVQVLVDAVHELSKPYHIKG